MSNRTQSPGLPRAVAAIVADAQEQRRIAEKLVHDLVDAAFSRSTMPRSPEYKSGVEAYLLFRALGQRLSTPYPKGTAQFDAWLAGLDEGKGWWRYQVAQHFPGR